MALGLRELGKSGVRVTELGFGGAPIGAIGGRVTDADAHKILRQAYDAGIRYFDTAPLYGHGLSEKRVGGFLQTVDRDSFALSTKIGRLLVPADEGTRYAGMRDEEPFSIQYDYSYDAVRRSFDASLSRLGLSRIDVLLCHDIDVWTHGDAQPEVFATARNGALKALSDMREEGVIRAFGLGVNEAAVCSEVLDLFKVDCFLLAGRFTLLEQDPLDHLIPKCIENETSLIIGGPYNSGLLAVRERRRATYDYKPVDDTRWQKAEAIKAVCDVHGVDPRAAALQYPLRHPVTAAVIPGVISASELETNLELVAAPIPDALWNDLDKQGLARKIDAKTRG